MLCSGMRTTVCCIKVRINNIRPEPGNAYQEPDTNGEPRHYLQLESEVRRKRGSLPLLRWNGVLTLFTIFTLAAFIYCAVFISELKASVQLCSDSGPVPANDNDAQLLPANCTVVQLIPENRTDAQLVHENLTDAQLFPENCTDAQLVLANHSKCQQALLVCGNVLRLL